MKGIPLSGMGRGFFSAIVRLYLASLPVEKLCW